MAQVPCAAWKESVGSSTSVLSCDDSCALAERNKRLADALDVDLEKAASSLSSSSSVDYAEPLLRFAHNNLVACKSVEKTLKEFVEDSSRRLHHFPRVKGGGNAFIVGLAAHYNLVGEIIDADRGQGSALVRKTAAKAPTVPSPLISTVAATYRPSLFPTAASTASEKAPPSPLTGRPPVNGLHIMSLQCGMDSRDIQILLQPIFGGEVSLSVRWVSEDDAVVMLTGSKRIGPDEIESLLLGAEADVKSKFVGTNSFAKDVKCCWVTGEGEIILANKFQPATPASGAESTGMGAWRKKPILMGPATPVTHPNAFEILAGEVGTANETKQGNQKQGWKEGKNGESNGPGEQGSLLPTHDTWDEDEDDDPPSVPLVNGARAGSDEGEN
ncbi:hypothetical protein HK104_004384 [Borealophlyctis nickersoniae]|nr:hypothetical protein HK104_004384 [Borealophlyctis nickersoniae]